MAASKHATRPSSNAAHGYSVLEPLPKPVLPAQAPEATGNSPTGPTGVWLVVASLDEALVPSLREVTSALDVASVPEVASEFVAVVVASLVLVEPVVLVALVLDAPLLVLLGATAALVVAEVSLLVPTLVLPPVVAFDELVAPVELVLVALVSDDVSCAFPGPAASLQPKTKAAVTHAPEVATKPTERRSESRRNCMRHVYFAPAFVATR